MHSIRGVAAAGPVGSSSLVIFFVHIAHNSEGRVDALPMIVQSAQSALYGPLQFIGSAIDGLVQVRCLVSNGRGLATLEACFHHAALVVLAALMSVFIAEVNFHPRDVFSEAAEGAFDHTLDVIC